MQVGDRYKAKNTMFWRADEKLAALARDQRWIDFHRACGRDGLFFDDIDPVNDDPKKDVTDRMRGRGYTAIAFRIDKDGRGFLIQRFVARGKGEDPVAAVIDTYKNAIAAGDAVTPGHEQIFDAEADHPADCGCTLCRADAVVASRESNEPEEIDIEELIG
jgi:hypothetical protein